MSSSDYSRYTLEDFLFDDAFRRWATQPDASLTAHWRAVGQQHPHLVPLMEQAARLLPALRSETALLPDDRRERIWQVLDHRFQTAAAPRPLRSRQLVPVWAVAATVTLLLLGAGWWLRRPEPTETVRTAYGQTRSVTLPDGSVVTLNGNSSLTYARTWEADSPREVWLEGEGFFVVRKRQSPQGRVKFVTHTPQLDIRVLGTQFNVNTRRRSTAVTLVEGKIELTEPRTARPRVIELRPGQQARLTPQRPEVVVATVRPDVPAAWTRNQFLFENTPLRDISAMILDTYGYEVVFGDEQLADKRFTGNLSRQNLDTLLDVLAATYDLHVTRTGNRIEFRRRP